jgi:hypothetical protein
MESLIRTLCLIGRHSSTWRVEDMFFFERGLYSLGSVTSWRLDNRI